MKLKAFSIKQRGGMDDIRIYVSIIPALELVERCTIDRWTSTNPKGYQRMPQEGRFSDAKGSIVRYLMKEYGCFPTSILINIRGDLEFKLQEDMDWFQVGEIDITDKSLWLIDGQHRVEALKRAIDHNEYYESYPVIVSFMQLPKLFDELLLFYIVNRRQKSVPTDLAYRHLQTIMGEKGVDWLYAMEGKRGVSLGIAAGIVDILSENPESPWNGRINLVHETKSDVHIIPYKILIRSIADVLRDSIFQGMTQQELADLLIDYWTIIRNLYPEAYENPRDYSLLGTPGIDSMHRLFPIIYGRCAQRGIITRDAMRQYLVLLQEETNTHPNVDFRKLMTLKFWSKREGPLIALATSKQNISELYRNILRKLDIAVGSTPSLL